MLVSRLLLIRTTPLGLMLMGAVFLLPATVSGQSDGKPAATTAVAAPMPLGATCGAIPTDSVLRAGLADAERLRADYRDSEALGRYEQVLDRAPASYEALWQAAALSVRIGNRYTDETRRFAYYASARLYANRALVVCPDRAEAHYAAALVLAAEAPLRPLGSRLLAYRAMRSHVYRATELRPNWSEAWQQLGRWQYRIDHYSLPERVYSRLFMGGVPEGGSTLQAIESLRRAFELDSGRIEVAYDLARVYLNRDQYTRARSALYAARQLTPVTAEELVISRRCERLLDQLNRQQQRRQPRLRLWL